jgi:hypothetical protein
MQLQQRTQKTPKVKPEDTRKTFTNAFKLKIPYQFIKCYNLYFETKLYIEYMMKNLKKNILKKVLNILDMKNSIQI